MESQLGGGTNAQDGNSEDDTDQSMKAVGAAEHEEQRLESFVPQFETVDGSYHFALSGYSLAKGVGSGRYFSSGIFTVGGHSWAIYFYPDGKNDGPHSEFVSVFIVLESDSSDVQALFEITLLDRSGRGKHRIHSHFDGRRKSPFTLHCQGAMWGYKRYFRRGALENSAFLKDDTLEFRGRVGVLLSSIKPTKLIVTTISPLPQEGNTPNQQSSGDIEASPKDTNEISPQLEDAVVRNFKGLGLEDQLARYHLELLSSQSPFKVRTNSEPENDQSTSESTVVSVRRKE